jgi:hypothetical protein
MAAPLLDGKVLIAGGYKGLNDAEVFDPATGASSVVGGMAVGRREATATLLPNGAVLVVGGATASAEIYNPLTGTFSTTGSLSVPRSDHTATLLPSGKVLITGGSLSANEATSSAELYDPESGTFAFAGRMSIARSVHTATLMGDGRILIAGGFLPRFEAYTTLDSAELYDPTSGQFTITGSLPGARFGHTATLLSQRCLVDTIP